MNQRAESDVPLLARACHTTLKEVQNHTSHANRKNGHNGYKHCEPEYLDLQKYHYMLLSNGIF
jgi:hypothetical protein